MAKKITLGITGSIAAYKAAELASALTRAGHDVHVVMTQNASEFISPLTFETLTKNRVYCDMFSDEDHTQVTHIDLGTTSDLIFVAPASYNILGKAAQGLADDLLSSILAAASPAKVMFAPAMNNNMYDNPACQANIATLRERGCSFVEPEEGQLACNSVGRGRLAANPVLLEAVDDYFCAKTLTDLRVLITAGATREYLDPIRFLSNASSGRMGIELARACRMRGAKVTLLLANSNLTIDGVDIVRVDTVSDLYREAVKAFDQCDWLFAAAAVSDFKPKTTSDSKIKKQSASLLLELVPNTDVLYELGQLKKHQKMIGFAAESENLIDNAKAKLKSKNLDLIVANTLDNFAAAKGSAHLVSSKGVAKLALQDKSTLASAIVDGAQEIFKDDTDN